MNEGDLLGRISPESPVLPASDRLAVDRLLRVVPVWRGAALARRLLEIDDRTLLHAGPPINDIDRICEPVLNSAAIAALFEGWAKTAEDARRLVRSGAIKFRPAQELGCVVPLADVLSPSMFVQIVEDAAGIARPAYSPFNGGTQHVIRVGQFDLKALERLKWLNSALALALPSAFDEPIPLLAIADKGLVQGDDCHGKTASASASMVEVLTTRVRGSTASESLAFLREASGFFLNLWMAASKCMMNAAADTAGSSVVVAAGGNGVDFGIQVAGHSGVWYCGRAAPPRMPPSLSHLAGDALGAIGDSAVVDLLGLGAMTTLSSTSTRHDESVAQVFPSVGEVAESLLTVRHSGMPLSKPKMVIAARAVVASGKTPIVSLGVLDKAGLRGRLGGGFYRPPVDIFAEAIIGLRE